MSELQNTATGESGSMVSSPPTLPDQNTAPNTIAQYTTSSETVSQIIYRNWIFKSILTITPDMQIGHVFGLIRIHPFDCHDYVKHVAKMFNTWTGGMKVRARFMANFTNGGSFRIGYLPPSMTQAQITQGLPLATLTAYPNMDLDPKNTDWTETRFEDERQVQYHYMSPPDETDPNSFGGWIVFFVAGPLVTTLQAQGNTSLLIEVAGDFHFRQVAPLTSGSGPTPPSADPLSDFAKQNLLVQLTTDAPMMTTNRNALQITSSDVQALPDGFIYAMGINGKDPWSFTGGDTISVPYTTMRPSVLSGAFGVSGHFAGGYDGTKADHQNEFAPYDAFFEHIVPVTACENNFWVQPFDRFPQGANIRDGRFRVTRIVYNPSTPATPSFLTESFTTEYTDKKQPAACYLLREGTNHPVDLGRTNSDIFNKLTPMPSGESIVLFVNTAYGTFSMQTKAIRDSIAKFAGNDNTTSWLYNVHQEGITGALATIRLCPNGMFTAPATKTSLLINPENANLYLVFLQTLPITSPIPTRVTMRTYTYLKVAARALRAGEDHAYRAYVESNIDE